MSEIHLELDPNADPEAYILHLEEQVRTFVKTCTGLEKRAAELELQLADARKTVAAYQRSNDGLHEEWEDAKRESQKMAELYAESLGKRQALKRQVEAMSWRKVEFGPGKNGNIELREGAPFDGKPVLIKTGTGVIEAYWFEGGWSDETPDHPREYDGFYWVCYDDQCQVELDAAKAWMPIPPGADTIADTTPDTEVI